eukprot:1777301-Rhodomonas_salina.6
MVLPGAAEGCSLFEFEEEEWLGIALRVCYALSGTDIVYGVIALSLHPEMEHKNPQFQYDL